MYFVARKYANTTVSGNKFNMPLDLIITKLNLLLSRTSKDWRVWQDEFVDYTASLTFEDEQELLDYLQLDYRLSEADVAKLSSEIFEDNREVIQLKLPGI